MRYLIISIVVLVSAPLTVIAGDILLLQGNRSGPIEQMTRLLLNDCAAGSRALVLSDYAEFDLFRVVREENPSVVVAIGDRSLEEARKLRGVQVVYGMVLNPVEENLAENVSGVSMAVSPESYMKLFSSLNLHRIGIIHDNRYTGAYVSRAMGAAKRDGIELVLLQVNSPEEVESKLTELGGGRIDALWILPDTTAITRETVDSYFLFAQRNRLPVIGFSSAYLSRGAVASLELARNELESLICSKIMSGRNGSSHGTIDSVPGRLLFNRELMEKLGLKIPSGTLLETTLTREG